MGSRPTVHWRRSQGEGFPNKENVTVDSLSRPSNSQTLDFESASSVVSAKTYDTRLSTASAALHGILKETCHGDSDLDWKRNDLLELDTNQNRPRSTLRYVCYQPRPIKWGLLIGNRPIIHQRRPSTVELLVELTFVAVDSAVRYMRGEEVRVEKRKRSRARHQREDRYRPMVRG